MSDKFERMSIYDIDWKTTDNDGKEEVFTFKPLPFKYYPKTYDLLNKLQEMGIDNESTNPLEKINQEIVTELIELEKVMVMRSYPDKKEEDIELFVMSNAFQLLEPLLKLINRQEVTNPRQSQAAQK